MSSVLQRILAIGVESQKTLRNNALLASIHITLNMSVYISCNLELTLCTGRHHRQIQIFIVLATGVLLFFTFIEKVWEVVLVPDIAFTSELMSDVLRLIRESSWYVLDIMDRQRVAASSAYGFIALNLCLFACATLDMLRCS